MQATTCVGQSPFTQIRNKMFDFSEISSWLHGFLTGYIPEWDADGQKKGLVILAEPQLWYNITKNFSVGTEFEISNNFIYPTCETTKTFYFNPTLGVKFNL